MINAKDLRLKENLNTVSSKAGYYKWWANKESLDIILNALETSFDEVGKFIEKITYNGQDLFCIYIGIASKESIKSRLNWHINQKHTETNVTRGYLSTLRQSISSITVHNQRDEIATNNFIDTLKVEYFESDLTIKSPEAKKELHSIELEHMKNNLYILNIQDNKFPQAKELKRKLKRLRKESK